MYKKIIQKNNGQLFSLIQFAPSAMTKYNKYNLDLKLNSYHRLPKL